MMASDMRGYGSAAQPNAAPQPAAPTGPGWRPRPTGPAPTPVAGGWRGPARSPAPVAPSPAASPTGGTESGPGILEQWFNQRAGGTDPAFEYMSKRGGDAIDARMAAGVSFNSGARGQQLGDFMSNLTSQRMGALDNLAGGASGEHAGRLDSMFRQGLGIAGGMAGASAPYDMAASNATGEMNRAQLEMFLNKAGVDPKAQQGLVDNIFSAVSLAKGGGGKTPAK